MGGGLKLGPGWAKLAMKISPDKFDANLKKHVGRATEINALLLAKRIRDGIKAGIAPANKALTVEIKRSSKPLVGKDGLLFQAITGRAINWKHGEAGVKRSARTADGKDLVNVAKIVHNGCTIPVTVKMRNLFRLLWLVSSGKAKPEMLKGRAADLYRANPSAKWFPLAPGTTHITIPSRPFIRLAVKDTAVQAKIAENWAAAVKAAMAEG